MTLGIAIKTLPLAAILLGCGLAANALAQDSAIPSSASNALPPPDSWRCDRIAPEYDAWLEGGNTADTWRFVGPTYRDVGSDRLYDWDDWLAWHSKSCIAAGRDAGGMPDTGLLIGGIVGALGVTALAAGSGGGSGGHDSPG